MATPGLCSSIVARLSRIPSLILTALCLGACVGADQYRVPHVPDVPKLTILVPGYQGSFLYDGDTRVWASPLETFSAGDRSLGSCDGGRLPLTPGGPITGFTIFPVHVDIYGSFMAWGQKRLPGFTAFGYDWRESLIGTAQKLCDFIGDRHADIIAHSMGGLVTLLALKRCGDHIDRIVFAGTPFSGAPGIFDDMFTGTKTVRNTALLSAPALWTFSSAWQLMPVKDDFFVDELGQPIELPISDPLTWRSNAWPLACPALLEARLADRAAMLNAEGQGVTVAPGVLAIIGHGRPVIDFVRVKGQWFDFKNPVLADGDGSVVARRAEPPLKATIVTTDAPHAQLLNDDGMRTAIEDFLK